MNDSNPVKIWKALDDFISCISRGDTPTLEKKYNISEAVFAEIKENIIDFLGENYSISPPPIEIAPTTQKGNRKNLDSFLMNDNKTIGIECVIWSKGKPTEAILHVELEAQDGEYRLNYKYIGS